MNFISTMLVPTGSVLYWQFSLNPHDSANVNQFLKLAGVDLQAKGQCSISRGPGTLVVVFQLPPSVAG